MLFITRENDDLWCASGPEYRFYVRALSMPQALRKAAGLLARFQKIEAS